jgi:hypothetical protein
VGNVQRFISMMLARWRGLRRDDRGALGAEWVVIIAILVIFTISVLGYLLGQADLISDATGGALEAISDDPALTATPTIGPFGDGT